MPKKKEGCLKLPFLKLRSYSLGWRRVRRGQQGKQGGIYNTFNYKDFFKKLLRRVQLNSLFWLHRKKKILIHQDKTFQDILHLN